jgi:phosphohistidine phosphatase SixA
MNRRPKSPTVAFTLWVRFTILALSGSFIAHAANLTTTVVIIRHAERASFFDTDSPLSRKGLRRADGLAYLLDRFNPETLVVSNLVRTQQTLRPLSEHMHRPLVIWDYRQTASLASYLKATYSGKTVLVCWHHDHMGEFARALGVEGSVPDWSMFTFNKIWIVTLPGNGPGKLQIQTQWGNQ